MDCHYYPAAHFHRVSWVYWLPWIGLMKHCCHELMMQTFTPGRLRIVQPILCGLSWGLNSYENIQELAPIHKPATEGGSQAQMLFSFPCTSQIYLQRERESEWQREREIRIDVYCWLAASILRCGSILASVTKKIGPTTYDQFHVIPSPNNIEHTSPELFKHVRTKKNSDGLQIYMSLKNSFVFFPCCFEFWKIW